MPRELTEAHKKKLQEGRLKAKTKAAKAEAKALRDTIKSLEKLIETYTAAQTKAWDEYQAKKSEKTFNTWLRADTNLMNTLQALRAHQER